MKICFVGNLSHTFAKRDHEILSRYFDVDVIQPPRSKSGWLRYPGRVKQMVRRADVVFGWFAGWHTAPAVHYARRYGKKSVVVAGGYDAACVPELDYGAFTNLKEKIPAKYVLKNANLLLPVSEFVKKEIEERVVAPKRVRVVYNGVDVDTFSPSQDKEPLVVTVGSKIRLKGLDTFAKASTHFPKHTFVVIGMERDSRLASINPDLFFTGRISHEKVSEWLQKAKVYCQLSYIESFGMGLAEAMACECIPIVTERGAIPEIVGNTGFYVPYGNGEMTVKAICAAIDTSSDINGKKARRRINNNVSLKNRKKALKEIMGELNE